MQRWDDLVGWLQTEMAYPKMITHPGTKQSQRWVTSLIGPMTLPLRYADNPALLRRVGSWVGLGGLLRIEVMCLYEDGYYKTGPM